MVGYLPEVLEVGGIDYEINSDFRSCLAVLAAFNDSELTNQDKLMVMLEIIFGKESMAKIADYGEAYAKAVWFLNCGKDVGAVAEDKALPPLMDWEQDEQFIFAGIATTIGRDIRMDSYCHYWSFIAYFMGMGECMFTSIKSIRHKQSKHEKLEKWEQDFYRDNREIVDIRREAEGREGLFREVFGL